MNVTLSNDLRDFVRQKVDCGEFPSEEAVLREALRRFRLQGGVGCGADDEPTPNDLIDYEAIEYCIREVAGKEIPSIEEVRSALSKIHGSMAQAVIEEREGRS
jgi:hypothetical protein